MFTLDGSDLSGLIAQGLESNGQALNYSVSGDTLTAYTGAAPGDGDVFTLQLSANGDYVFTLLDQLDHPTADGADDELLAIDFGSIVDVADADGDVLELAGGFVINVEDDVPVAAEALVEGFVYEDGLADGNPDTPANPDDDGDGNQLTATGSIAALVSVGADQVGVFTLDGSDLSGLIAQGLESNGLALNYSVSGDTLTAYTGAAPGDGDVFTLQLSANGDYVFTLLDQLDHPAADGNDDELLAIDFGSIVDVADADGDVLELAGGFVINVEDDVPVAEEALVEGFVYEDGLADGNPDAPANPDDDGDGNQLTATGSIAALVSVGADQVGVFTLDGSDLSGLIAQGLESNGLALNYSVSGDTLYAYTGAAPGDGDVFTLQLSANGDYVFTLLDQLDHPTADGADDELLAIDFGSIVDVADADGDVLELAGGFVVNVEDDVPVAAEALVEGFVYEDGLADGNPDAPANPDDDGDGNQLTATGSIAALVSVGADQVGVFTLDSDLSGLIAQGLESNGQALNYSVSGDTLTAYTGAAPGDGDVFTLQLSANGDYVFTLLDQLDHPTADGNDDELLAIDFGSIVDVADADGDVLELAGGFVVNVEDDVPVAEEALIEGFVYEDGLADGNPDAPANPDDDGDGNQLTATGSIAALVSVGADQVGVFTLDSDLSGLIAQGLESNGLALNYSVSGDTLTAYTGAAPGDGDVFTLQLAANGDYVFTLLDQLDHPTADGNDDELLAIDFGSIVDVADADGDVLELAGGFVINVEDDVPVAAEALVEGFVYEDGLADGNPDAPANPDDDGDGNPLTATGSIAALVSVGADQVGVFTLDSDLSGLIAQGLESNGQALNYVVVGDTLYAYTGDGALDGDGIPTTGQVFTLQLAANGDYVFTLLDQLDHPTADGNDDELLAIDFGSIVDVADADGDVLELAGGFVINVEDDVPVAAEALVEGFVYEDGLADGNPDTPANPDDDGDGDQLTATGSIAALVSVGADQVGVFTLDSDLSGLIAQGLESNGQALNYVVVGDTLYAYTGDGALDGDGIPTTGQVFTLQLAANGDYVFTLLDQLDHPTADGNDDELLAIDFGSIVDVADADGDVLELAGGFVINVEDDVPVAAEALVEGFVYEDGLADGNPDAPANPDDDGDGNPLTATGSIAALVSVGADQVGVFTLDGSDLSGLIAQGLESNGLALNYSVSGDTLYAYTGAAPGDGDVFTLQLSANGDYVFTLLDQLDHPAADGNDDELLAIDFGSIVDVADADGDVLELAGGFVINVEDDVPVAEEALVEGFVYEDGLADGNPDTPANPDDDGDGNPLTATGSIAALVSVGADQVGVFTLDGSDLSGLIAQGLTSNGQALNYSVSGDILTAYTGAAPGDGDVFTLQLSANGDYVFTLLDQLDHPTADGNDDELLAIDFGSIVDVADADGDVLELAGGFVINVEDDVPVAAEALVEGFVYEDGLADGNPDAPANPDDDGDGNQLTATGSIAALVSVGADQVGVFTLDSDLSGLIAQGLESNGQALNYSVSGDILTAYTGAAPGDGDVFTLQLAANGDYVFTLLDQLDHPTADGNDDDELLAIDFGSIVDVADADGDVLELAGGFVINVEDDVPVAAEALVEGFVYEDGLADGNPDAPANPDDDGDGNQLTATGSIAALVSVGADQVGVFTLDGSDLSGLIAQGLESNGLALNYSVSGDTLTAYTGAAPGDGDVFTLQLAANGDYVFTLLDQLDHPTADGNDDELLAIDFGSIVDVADADGDVLELAGGFVINVEDDVPVAAEALVEGFVYEDGLADGNPDAPANPDDDGDGNQLTATGSIAALVSVGADQVGVFTLDGSDLSGLIAQGLESNGLALNYSVSGDTLTAYTGAAPGDGDVFTLQLSANGDYVFTLLDQLDHPTADGADDELLAIDFGSIVDVADADGDVLELAGGFVINVEDDVPVAAEALVEGFVYEDGLADGNPDAPANPDDDGDGNQLTATGSIAALVSVGADQVGVFTLDGSDLSGLIAQGLTSNGLALNYSVSGDTLTAYTGAAPGDGDVFTLQLSANGDYVFTLLDQLDHPTADGADDELLAIDFGSIVDVADADGDVLELAGGFVINVEDDVPVAAEALVEGFVYEDGLADGNPDTPANPDDDGDGNPADRHWLDRGAGFGRRRSGWRVYARRFRSLRPDRPGAGIERPRPQL